MLTIGKNYDFPGPGDDVNFHALPIWMNYLIAQITHKGDNRLPCMLYDQKNLSPYKIKPVEYLTFKDILEASGE